MVMFCNESSEVIGSTPDTAFDLLLCVDIDQ